MPTQKLLALLVGIDKYDPRSHKNGVTDLKGCRNDVNAMADLLRTKYSYLQPDIKTLFDNKATHSSIIHAFQEHLIKPADENTTALFYFSGHGSRQPTSPIFQKYIANKYYELEETLVCYESRVTDDTLDLADKELAILIEEVSKKEAHVVVILDCCHSGSGTRKLDKEGKVNEAIPEGVREVKERTSKNTFKHKYFSTYYEDMEARGEEVTVPQGKHILLAGCRRDQYSREVTRKQEKRGAFTYHLEQMLKQYGQITYAKLFSATHAEILKEKYQEGANPQYPQFESYHFFDAHTYFLQGTSPGEKSERYLVKYDEDTKGWLIELGAVMGIPMEPNYRATFAIYEEPESKEMITHAEATWIGLNETGLKIENGSLATNKQYWAKIISLPLPRFSLCMNGNSALVENLRSTLIGHFSPYLEEVDSQQATFKVFLKDQSYQIYHHQKLKYNKEEDGVISMYEIIYKLEQIARWDILLHSNNQKSKIKSSDIDFNFLEGNSFKTAIQPEHILHLDKTVCEVVAHKGSYSTKPGNEWVLPYVITAQNHSKHQLYFTLLYLSSDYGIKVYRQEDAPPNSNKVILTDRHELYPGEERTSTDYFKLIVSTKELKPYLFEQPDLNAKATRPSRIKKGTVVPEDWLSKTIEVKLIKA